MVSKHFSSSSRKFGLPSADEFAPEAATDGYPPAPEADADGCLPVPFPAATLALAAAAPLDIPEDAELEAGSLKLPPELVCGGAGGFLKTFLTKTQVDFIPLRSHSDCSKLWMVSSASPC